MNRCEPDPAPQTDELPGLNKPYVANDQQSGTMLAVLRNALLKVVPGTGCIATAYLTPDGFTAISPELGAVPSVRLLLGERPFLTTLGPGETLSSGGDDLYGPDEAISWYDFLEGGLPWILMNHEERKHFVSDADNIPLLKDFDLTAWDKVRALVEFLNRSGVEVARYLGPRWQKYEGQKVLGREAAPDVHLHAKAYIFRGPEKAYAAVGSSNLTKGGLQNNVELNLTTTDEKLVADLEAWFDRKWQESLDCKEEFIELLEDCVLFGRHFRPWQVFIKALHTAYGKYLGLGLGEDLQQQLAQFQQEGVSRCVQLMEQHWGVMLCDSVGLGKTYVGLGILKEYLSRQKTAKRALVVCPAQLENNWSSDRLHSWGIAGRTISMEFLPQLVDLEEVEDPGRRTQLERLKRQLQAHDVVLVDESHNFRNPGTKRYRALMELIRGGTKPDKRVVLLTATPINNSLWDLYHQLMLITRGDNTWYVGRGPVGNLEGIFRELEKSGGGPRLLDTMLISMVRRTRHDIRERQDAGEPLEIDGRPLKFPEHHIPEAISYSLEDLYAGIYDQVIDTIKRLNFAVYNLDAYGLEKQLNNKEREERDRAVKRNESYIGILKTTYLKRAESSLAALTSTVQNQVRYLESFLELLAQGKVLRPKDAQKIKVVFGGNLPDDLTQVAEVNEKLEALLAKLPHVEAALYEQERLNRDVTEDLRVMRKLGALLADADSRWREVGDPKVQALRELLEGLPATDDRGEPTKVVVFSNYKDTIDYIFAQLGGPCTDEWKGKLRCLSNLPNGAYISKLTGADDTKRRRQVLERFAPLAAVREDEELDDPDLLLRIEPLRSERIDILMATDVLSEGQNLQDAQHLVNYDLHWNPVRMIQRAGRIDRLFSPHDDIYIYNMMPEKGLDKLLNLVKRLQGRVSAIDATMGLDASVLGEEIEQKALDQWMAIRAGGERADQVYREGEKRQDLDNALDEIRQYLELVRNLGTEEVRALKDGIYSVKEGDQPGVFIMLKMPDEYGGQVFWRFCEDKTGQVVKSALEIVPTIQAAREDPRAYLEATDNPFRFLVEPLTQAIAELGQEYRRQASSQDPSELVKVIRRHLQNDQVEENIPELAETLRRWCGEAHPTDLLKRDDDVQDAYRILRQPGLGPLGVIDGLERLWEALRAKGLDRPLERPVSREPTERDLQLVCWELVVPKGKGDGANQH